MTHDERVTRLAEKMALDIVGNGRAGKYHADDVKDARPYAAAMVQAEEALEHATARTHLDRPGSCDGCALPYSALAALRALEAK